MKNFKYLPYCFMAIMIIIISTACDTGTKEKQDSHEAMAPPIASPADQASLKKQIDELRQMLSATETEAKFLNEKAAVCESGYQEGGYFSNQKGIVGYFLNYPKPFNFIWTGGSVAFTGIDGRRYNMMDGYGELIVKYMDAPTLLQRYKGHIKNGIWQGFGKYYSSYHEDGQEIGIAYEGEFVHDFMQGHAVYSFYNLSDINAEMYRYEGEMYSGDFNGYGAWSSLNTGQMLKKGLFLEGGTFSDIEESWKEVFDDILKSDPARQVYNLIALSQYWPTVDSVDMNRKTLTIYAPAKAKNIVITTDKGKTLPISTFERNQPPKAPEKLKQNVAKAALPIDAYPVGINISFDLEGKKNYLSFTVRNPSTIHLSPNKQQSDSME